MHKDGHTGMFVNRTKDTYQVLLARRHAGSMGINDFPILKNRLMNSFGIRKAAGRGTAGSRIDTTFQKPVSHFRDSSSSGIELTARCLPSSLINMTWVRFDRIEGIAPD